MERASAKGSYKNVPSQFRRQSSESPEGSDETTGRTSSEIRRRRDRPPLSRKKRESWMWLQCVGVTSRDFSVLIATTLVPPESCV
ncbi:hypothetical protein LQW54_011709 [Pestalotiopsis sp. IQ-011]